MDSWHRFLLGVSLILLLCSDDKLYMYLGAGMMLLAIVPIMIIRLITKVKEDRDDMLR